MKKDFDLLSLGEILLRLSPPNNERIVRGETFQKPSRNSRRWSRRAFTR